MSFHPSFIPSLLQGLGKWIDLEPRTPKLQRHTQFELVVLCVFGASGWLGRTLCGVMDYCLVLGSEDLQAPGE